MDAELCDGLHIPGQSDASKHALADVVVARESDFGHSDETFHCTTHLGNLLDIGDIVLGYDLASAVLTGNDEWSMNNSFNSSFNVPDVVLVKKVHSGAATEEVVKEAQTDEKKKSKSSASKRRERRKIKEEKKMKEAAEGLGRMGFTNSEAINKEDDNM
jgi:nonsense-mediated mRNA decay protein 3